MCINLASIKFNNFVYYEITLLKFECNHNTLQASTCMFNFNTKGAVKRCCDDTKRGSGNPISVEPSVIAIVGYFSDTPSIHLVFQSFDVCGTSLIPSFVRMAIQEAQMTCEIW